MEQFTLAIFLGGLTAFIVLLSGVIGGVEFGLIIKRMFLFGLILGGIGFVITFLLKKWGYDLGDSSAVKNTGEGEEGEESEQEEEKTEGAFASSNGGKQLGDEAVSLLNQESQPAKASETLKEKEKKGNSDNVFDYTVNDDDDIEFKPLDESLLEKEKKQFIDYQGEKIEYDPKRAAQAIRQLLDEDKKNGE